MDLSTNFGKEIPSRNLREKRSVSEFDMDKFVLELICSPARGMALVEWYLRRLHFLRNCPCHQNDCMQLSLFR